MTQRDVLIWKWLCLKILDMPSKQENYVGSRHGDAWAKQSACAQLLPPEILNVMELLDSMRGCRDAGGAGTDLEAAALQGQVRLAPACWSSAKN